MVRRVAAVAAFAGLAAANAPAEIRSYGSWPSPVSAARVAEAGGGFADLVAEEEVLTWTESRPGQGGRSTLMRLGATGQPFELTPGPWDVRSAVHDSGGGAHGIAGPLTWFSNAADQRLYVLGSSGATAITPTGFRYADCTGLAAVLICVREDHRGPGEPRNILVRLDPSSEGEGEPLYEGSDFVAYPRLSPDGKQLAFIAWNHPNMPWDGTRLFVGQVVRGRLAQLRAVAGGARESVMDPQWDRDGSLYFLSDRTGWSDLYRWRGGAAEPMWPHRADQDAPLTHLGLSNYALTGDGRAAARFTSHGRDHLAVIDLKAHGARVLALPFVRLEDLRLRGPGRVAMFAAGEASFPALVEVDLGSGRWRTLRRAPGWSPPIALISRPREIVFPSPAGGLAYAFFYPPARREFSDPRHKPPLVVQAHGGPVGAASPALDLGVQFWTSRGFALLDVNFHGSSGYGRAYRESIYERWGVADLGDVVAAARYVASEGWCDPKRMAVRGRSGGGFIVLSALAFTKQFEAGADYYGISDLEALAATTHKFESSYPERLIAPLPSGRPLFEARSPIFHLGGITAPLAIFQGADDPTVPPDQSRRIVAALRARGNRVDYLEFPGEGHGFRKAEDRALSLEAEYALYRRVFRLD